MRVISTDNFGGDYPDEKFLSESISLEDANKLAEKLNWGVTDYTPRYHLVVPDDYTLQPGFEP